ncbi:hypothetical protein [Sinobaca sp. H24]|uniref:hypothetical protein n=1 Tax=Sinobaca sp. H24 TaxID=2923376 RepID=UPI002079753C|nr:hypothetical protein [Sinobaca sp. H24]
MHTITKKGKGYAPAENDAKGTWHGLGPYKIDSGEVVLKSRVLQPTAVFSAPRSKEWPQPILIL